MERVSTPVWVDGSGDEAGRAWRPALANRYLRRTIVRVPEKPATVMR